MVDHSMVPSSGQAGVVSHGVEVAAEPLVAAEGSVVGGNSMGTSDGTLPSPCLCSLQPHLPTLYQHGSGPIGGRLAGWLGALDCFK
jgi:hypothetical protein